MVSNFKHFPFQVVLFFSYSTQLKTNTCPLITPTWAFSNISGLLALQFVQFLAAFKITDLLGLEFSFFLNFSPNFAKKRPSFFFLSLTCMNNTVITFNAQQTWILQSHLCFWKDPQKGGFFCGPLVFLTPDLVFLTPPCFFDPWQPCFFDPWPPCFFDPWQPCFFDPWPCFLDPWPYRCRPRVLFFWPLTLFFWPPKPCFFDPSPCFFDPLLPPKLLTSSQGLK